MINQLNQYCEVTMNNKEAVEELLFNISNFDMDFTGENGEEYLWDEARELGFESNASYCMHVAKQETNTEDMVYKFLSMWMQRDCNYYVDYTFSVRTAGDYIFVALSYIND